jgi:protease I
MPTVLMPIPNSDFDPTETAVPWKILRAHGHEVVFATPNGRPGKADARMLTGTGLFIFAPVLRANADALRPTERWSGVKNSGIPSPMRP